MSLGRSSDGRLFTRDGRLCVGCCSGLPCDPFNRCIPFSTRLGCTLDFGEAFERWRVGIDVRELFLDLAWVQRDTLPNGFVVESRRIERRVENVVAPAWSGIVSIDGSPTLGLCGMVAPPSSYTGRFLSQVNGNTDQLQDGVPRVYTHEGGWPGSNNALIDDNGIVRIDTSLYPPPQPDYDDLLLRNLIRREGTQFQSVITTFDGAATSVSPGGGFAGHLFIGGVLSTGLRALQSGQACVRSGTRTFTNYIESSGDYFPQFSVTGSIFPNLGPSPTDTALPQRQPASFTGPPPDQFNEAYSVGVTQTATGFDFEYTHTISSERYRWNFDAPSPGWYLFNELDETRTYRISYTMEPAGNCPPPGVSGFFA